jgi:2-hydroxy-3-oxopropionate reductase
MMVEDDLKKIGFIGLGAMGGPMARNLVRGGFEVAGYDHNLNHLEKARLNGILPCQSLAEAVEPSSVICTSLPTSEVWVKVMEEEMMPLLRAGQVVIDFGTVSPPETRAMARRLSLKDVVLLDVPVAGGVWGAENAVLYMFAGGEEEVFGRCLPILEAIGGPELITYCGGSGNGQVVKGVNQLMVALGAAAYLEALSFGVNAGVDVDVVRHALGKTGRWRGDFNFIATEVLEGRGQQVGVRFRELPYYLREAADGDFSLPLTDVLFHYCDRGERVVMDDNQMSPSLWYQLVIKKGLKK